ncbi:MAG: ribonuclease P protein component [Gammaproteobacteria bacterium]|nr:ribonuclease P protein component [Gammaproteobacteria bacterium]
MDPVRFRFSKSHRLLKPSDYRHVFQRARKRPARGFTVYICPNALGHPRLGIAISRKCLPSAVARNRAKRIIRECFRLRTHDLGGVDIVFLGRQGLAGQDREELRAVVSAQFAEIEQCAGC